MEGRVRRECESLSRGGEGEEVVIRSGGVWVGDKVYCR